MLYFYNPFYAFSYCLSFLADLKMSKCFFFSSESIKRVGGNKFLTHRNVSLLFLSKLFGARLSLAF